MSPGSIGIIGGSGFIGSYLGRKLQQLGNRSFYIVDKVQSPRFAELSRIADVRSLEALRAVIADESLLIHLAAEHRYLSLLRWDYFGFSSRVVTGFSPIRPQSFCSFG